MNFKSAAHGRVVVVGDIMTDIIVVADGPPIVGSDRRAVISEVEGGSAANQAAWLAASGVPVVLFAKVAAGDLAPISARLKAEGILPILAGDEKRETGRLVTLIGPSGERSFFTDRGANLALDLADLPQDWHEGTDLLVLSGYSFFEKGPRACAIGMIKAARKHQVPVVVDAASAGFIADGGSDRFLKWTAGADLLVANQDETALLSGRFDPEDQMMALLDHYGSIIVKRGAKGGLFRRRGERPVHAPGVKAEVVDTTGAGDAFLAGFIAAWREGSDVLDCLAAGNRLGAVAVAQIGGRPPRTAT
jgi:sugar/nucleoside kinase (ribokinase family)